MKSRYIDENELQAIQGRMGETAFLPFAVSLETGLRIGDVLKLRHDDVKGGYIYFTAEKTKKAGKAKISRITARRLVADNGSAFCFPGRDKRKHLTRQAAWQRLKRTCAKYGIDAAGISPHSMRKVFGVEVYKNEGAEAARQALQHNDLRTTEIYILSDWLTGDNANKPLVRADLARIVEEIFLILKMNVDKL